MSSGNPVPTAYVRLEEQGFEPWAFRMQSGRSATELHPLHKCMGHWPRYGAVVGLDEAEAALALPAEGHARLLLAGGPAAPAAAAAGAAARAGARAAAAALARAGAGAGSGSRLAHGVLALLFWLARLW